MQGMKYIDRAIASRLTALAEHFPVIVVSGARQVGKSTLLAKTLGTGIDYVTFDPVLDIEGARGDPDLFLANHRRPIVLDEIQYAPEVASAVKRSVDRDRSSGSFFISGSQQWSVIRGLSDSLAGRAVFLDLEAFSIAELGKGTSWLESWLKSKRPSASGFRGDAEITLPERMWRGWMPETQVLPLDMVPVFYEGYLRTYIEHDARNFASPQDLQVFGSFARLAASLTGQEILYSSIARELGVSGPTAARWFDTLSSTFQYQLISAFSGNPVKRVTSKPKGIMREIGLAVNLLGLANPGSVADSPLRGRLFETLVIGEIRKAASLLSPAPSLYHWRSTGGAEVDLVLEWDGTLYPVEIKMASAPGKRDMSGLTAFRAAHPSYRLAPGLILCACTSPYPITENCWAMPWDWLEKE